MKELCCWGCGQEAVLPKTKWGKGPRCSEKPYSCPGYKKKISHIPWNKGLKGDPRQARPDQIGRLFGLALTGHTEESKKKISKSMLGNKNAQHRGDRQSFYNSIRMDSTWEVGVAIYLDENLFYWVYNERGFELSDGRFYYPDFFIYDKEHNFLKLIEVKGYFREENKLKFAQFQAEYPEIKVELWNKEVLFDLNIINKSGYVKNKGECP